MKYKLGRCRSLCKFNRLTFLPLDGRLRDGVSLFVDAPLSSKTALHQIIAGTSNNNTKRVSIITIVVLLLHSNQKCIHQLVSFLGRGVSDPSFPSEREAELVFENRQDLLFSL